MGGVIADAAHPFPMSVFRWTKEVAEYVLADFLTENGAVIAGHSRVDSGPYATVRIVFNETAIGRPLKRHRAGRIGETRL